MQTVNVRYDYEFEIPVEPVAAARPRVTKHVTYNPKKMTDNKEIIRRYLLTMHRWSQRQPISGPVFVNVNFYLPRPKRCPRLLPHVRPDLDNYLKQLFDAMNGIVWLDDGQVCGTLVWKVYDERPRIEVKLKEL